MAFRSNGPINLTLPPFRGVTRRIILIAVVCYFLTLLLGAFLPDMLGLVVGLFALEPGKVFGRQVWQVVSYPFFGNGLFGVLLASLSVWFFGSGLEEERGPRWLGEYFLVATIGGGVLACLLAPALKLTDAVAAGLWPFALAIVVAYAVFHPDQPLRFNFIFTLKAKYLAVIYMLLYLAYALAGADRLNAVVALANATAGVAFLKLAPRQGVRVLLSERWFALRNAFYRNKRRRAAKQFTVYMRKQGKDTSLDADGRYIDPDGAPRDPNSKSNDRRWMN